LDCTTISIFDLAFSIFPLPAFYFPSLVLMDNSSGEDNSGNSYDETEKKLDSIISDREKLNKAKDNVNTEEQKKALEELQQKYANKLEGTETKSEFLDKIDEELKSKTEVIKHKNNVLDEEDIQHHAPEQVMDEIELVEKALKGDVIALSQVKDMFPEFFDEKSETEVVANSLKQIVEMLEEDFKGELANEEKIANELDESVKQNIRKNNPNLTDSEAQQAFEQIKKGNKRKRDDDDDDSEGNGRSGPGPSTEGPSTGDPPGPSIGSSSDSKVSSSINNTED
jgi:hypothetical protein